MKMICPIGVHVKDILTILALKQPMTSRIFLLNKMLNSEFCSNFARLKLLVREGKSHTPSHFFPGCPLLAAPPNRIASEKPHCPSDRRYRATGLHPSRSIC